VRGLLIANDADGDPGLVGEHLARRGCTLERWARELSGGWPLLDAPDLPDLVVLLGSDWSVYWPHVSTEVAAEQALVRAAHDRGIPLLAICFGAQVVASALGGIVERAPWPEIGWHRVDSLAPDVVHPGPWMQWHSDRCTLPPGATLLATSPVGPQAFRLGRTLAVQFHPEVTSSIVERWSAGAGAAELAAHGVDRDALLRETALRVEQIRPATERLVDEVLMLVR
jgi:GMP synthase-like glutamine amidotransferase